MEYHGKVTDHGFSPSRVLIVGAHPDDVDFGCAGTTATWTSSGVSVAYCIITDGAAGGRSTGRSREELRTLREKEQRAAGAVIGVTDITFLGYPDGELFATLELRKEVTRVIRRVRPDLVVCQSPERNWERIHASHPDHLAAGEATLCAVYPDARNPYSYPELLEEGLEAHVVTEVWLTGTSNPNHAIDITDAFDKKCEALQQHASQIDDVEALLARITAMGAKTAEEMGLGEGCKAETFRRINTQ
ncbi:MAG: PIG-L deacetylase family protein [Candidatus Dormibacteria bacterium]